MRFMSCFVAATATVLMMAWSPVAWADGAGDTSPGQPDGGVAKPRAYRRPISDEDRRIHERHVRKMSHDSVVLNDAPVVSLAAYDPGDMQQAALGPYTAPQKQSSIHVHEAQKNGSSQRTAADGSSHVLLEKLSSDVPASECTHTEVTPVPVGTVFEDPKKGKKWKKTGAGDVGKGTFGTVSTVIEIDAAIPTDLVVKEAAEEKYAKTICAESDVTKEIESTIENSNSKMKETCVVKVHGYSKDGSWFVMEKLAFSLDDWATRRPLAKKRRKDNDSESDLECFQTVATEMIEVLTCFHGLDFVHGDVKPANILYAGTADECPKNLKLADFGLTLHEGEEAEHLEGLDEFTHLPNGIFDGVEDDDRWPESVRTKNAATYMVTEHIDWCSAAVLIAEIFDLDHMKKFIKMLDKRVDKKGVVVNKHQGEFVYCGLMGTPGSGRDLDIDLDPDPDMTEPKEE